MGKKRKKGKKQNRKSRHHIIPRSRGGTWIDSNISILDIEQHEKYHSIFGNMKPDEIIKHLVDVYWNGQWKWVKLSLNKLEY